LATAERDSSTCLRVTIDDKITAALPEWGFLL
jgi:hypothetical protein